MCKSCKCEPCRVSCFTRYPKWVKERAAEIANDKAEALAEKRFYRTDMFENRGFPALHAVADLVMKYEKPPVDPDLVLARKAVADVFTDSHCKQRTISGQYDAGLSVAAALRAIKMVKNT